MTQSTVKEVLCIPLSDGREATVDACESGRISSVRWHPGPSYVSGFFSDESGKRKSITLHRFIMGSPQGMQIDHIDGNVLNNCRSNLRVCTAKENRRNQKLRKDSQSRVKGVYCHPGKRVKRWQAKIKVDGKLISLGYHRTKEEAALAYNLGSVTYHGEFARPNEVSL